MFEFKIDYSKVFWRPKIKELYGNVFRRDETVVSFSLHIPVPVPDSIVLFCLGKWDGNESLEATLSYKDESVTLGKFTAFSRFVILFVTFKWCVPFLVMILRFGHENFLISILPLQLIQ